MYKLVVYVPATHLQGIKQALFDAGAGRIGDYDQCSWQVLGTGQFRPLAGSDPFVGKTGQVESVDEYRLEMVVDDQLVEPVIDALYRAHPYEEPAFDCWQLFDTAAFRPGPEESS